MLPVLLSQRCSISRCRKVFNELLLELHQPRDALIQQIALGHVLLKRHLRALDERQRIAKTIVLAQPLQLHLHIQQRRFLRHLLLRALLLHRLARCGDGRLDLRRIIALQIREHRYERRRLQLRLRARQVLQRNLRLLRCLLKIPDVRRHRFIRGKILQIIPHQLPVFPGPRRRSRRVRILVCAHPLHRARVRAQFPVLQAHDEEPQRLHRVRLERLCLRDIRRCGIRTELRHIRKERIQLRVHPNCIRRKVRTQLLQRLLRDDWTAHQKLHHRLVHCAPAMQRFAQPAIRKQLAERRRRLIALARHDIPPRLRILRLRRDSRIRLPSHRQIILRRDGRTIHPKIKPAAHDQRHRPKRNPAHAALHARHHHPRLRRRVRLPQLRPRKLQVLDERIVAVEPVLRIRRKRLVDHKRRRIAHTRRVAQQMHGVALDFFQLRHRITLRDKRRTPRNCVEKRRRQRIHIAPEILRRTIQLLRRHIERRRPHLPLLLVLLLHQNRQTKVHDLRRLIIRKQNVPRLDVAMDQSLLQPRPQAARNLRTHLQRTILRNLRPVRHQAVQTARAHHLHRQIHHALVLAIREHLHDIRMVQRCRDLRLTLKPLFEIRVLAELLANHLHRHRTVQLQITRPVHHALPALAQNALNLEVRENLPHTHPRPAPGAMNLRKNVLVRHID